MSSFKGALFVAALMLPQAAFAQSALCRLPQRLPDARPEYPPRAQDVRPAKVTNYLLTLSWSPGHCRTERNRDTTQCDGSAGRFGFVLHGLWPETDGPAYPQWCAPVPALSRQIIRENFCMTPSVDLLQHEWAKHGSCMTRDPQKYFRPARIMYEAIRYPDMDRMSRDRNLTVGTFRLNFARANKGIRPDMIQVAKTKENWLDEVRICLAKDFKPQRCPAHVRMPSDRSKLKIWRGGR